ncbi:MAG: hypothetical protein J6S59_08195 [Clostridia bacterium]|nr:hypothetical protein [Clostridia bacterium]
MTEKELGWYAAARAILAEKELSAAAALREIAAEVAVQKPAEPARKDAHMLK